MSLARYYVELFDNSLDRVAVFDHWATLDYSNPINDVGSYTLEIQGDDARRALFELDGLVIVRRSIPSLSVDWYVDFVGFHRRYDRSIDSDGTKTVISQGSGVNDYLRRKIINYLGGTVRTDKSDPSETVMKEYVAENCSAIATVANGRKISGVIPDFYVEGDTGLGPTWSGSRAFENLLDVLKEIALFSSIDFEVNYDYTTKQFIFKTYLNQLGDDRTNVGIVSTTGLNASGNAPVVFSAELGNVQDISYSYDRMSEANICSVLGKGEGSTRTVETVATGAITDSPSNACEIARPGEQQDFVYQLQALGYEILYDMKAREEYSFTPLQQPSCAYGKHYFRGDKVTIVDDGNVAHKRLTNVKTNVSAGNSQIEELTLEFTSII